MWGLFFRVWNCCCFVIEFCQAWMKSEERAQNTAIKKSKKNVLFQNSFWTTPPVLFVCTHDCDPNTITSLLGMQLVLVALLYDWFRVIKIMFLHAFLCTHAKWLFIIKPPVTAKKNVKKSFEHRSNWYLCLDLSDLT